MSGRTAHILEHKWRSDDIKIGENANFTSLLLPKELLKGLKLAGFKYPSPIQLKAIPIGKIGKDLIVQAKSGTGKTIVFTVIALNMLLREASHPQVLIMAPTREIACQICQVVKSVGYAYKGLNCEYFIGGRRLEEDVPRIQGCQVIVGTPGRIKQMINCKILKTGGIRLFVLDEADQLLHEASFTTDIDDIFRALPRDKQMIATSATYPDKLKKLTNKYFRDPLLIQLNKNDIGLLGMVHYYHVIPVSKLPVVAYKKKLKFLENVLMNVKFAQCLVFCNMVSRVENLCVEIKNWGFATSFISSAREQEDRLKAIELLKKFKCKVLVSSDVSARGIDAENVDLVINFDLPAYLETYFHRVGRAGRYGSKCASITFITSDEIESYQQMQIEGKFISYPLPEHIPTDLISMQPKTKTNVTDGELLCESESSSNSSFGGDLNENGVDLKENEVDKQEKSNGFTGAAKLNGHTELHMSKFDEVHLEKLVNEDLIDSEIVSIVSSYKKQNHLDISPGPTKSVKKDDDFSSALDVELDFVNGHSITCSELKQQEIGTDICPSTEIVAVEEGNDEVNENFGKESFENIKLKKKESVYENCSKFIVEDIKSCHSENLPYDTFGSQQILDESSCLADTESICEKSLKKKRIDKKSLIVNSDSKIRNPDSKQLISSAISYIKEYEHKNKETEECLTSDSTLSSEAIKAESNNNDFSSVSLEVLRSSSRTYYYDVLKSFVDNNLEVSTEEIISAYEEESITKVSEIEDLNCLKQNDGGNQIHYSGQDSQHVLFSTPKIEVASGSKSGQSSGPESSSGSDKDKLLEHFNLMVRTIAKVKPHKKLSSEGSSSSELDSDTSINSKDAMHLLTEEFNKVTIKGARRYPENANIIKNTELSSSSDSDSGTSVDSENAGDILEKEFTKLIKDKKNGGGSLKDTKETKRILQKIKGTNKCFKDIEIVDTKNPTESSSITSDSDVDTKNQGESSSSSSDSDAKRRKGESFTVKSPKSPKNKKSNNNPAGNVSDVDQYLKESSSHQREHQRQIHGKAKTLRSKTVKGAVQNKITYYYSGVSSETENEVDQYSSGTPSHIQGERRRKKNTHQKDETLPKTETSEFNYSNVNETANAYFNTASERPTFDLSHYYYQMQPTTYASNPSYQPFTQQIQSYAYHTQFGHQMQPTSYASNSYYQPYPNECPLKEFCQMGQMQHSGSGHSAANSNFQMNSNPSLNHVPSNYQQHPSYAYNQCIVPSQHPCHPPNEICQSPACAAWYDTFYKQWQFLNQPSYY